MRSIPIVVWLMGAVALAPGDAAGAPRPCTIGKHSGCPAGSYCGGYYRDAVCPSQGTCQPYLPGPEKLELSLPVPAGVEVYCAKGMLRPGTSTHNACDPTTRFAIDLAGTAADPPRFVLASAPGTAYIFRGCVTADLNRQEVPDTCNLGFGNMVRIDHGDGVYSQVAHLSSILVRNGSRVGRGDVIGIEGNTGNAGSKHIHWSLHRGTPTKLLPGPTLLMGRIRIRSRAGQTVVVSANRLTCADFGIDPKPYASTLLRSENEIAARPEARFGFVTHIDRAVIAVTSDDPKVRNHAMAQLRKAYRKAVVPYVLALGYLANGDPMTAKEELERAQRRAQRGEGPRWLEGKVTELLGRLKSKGVSQYSWAILPGTPGKLIEIKRIRLIPDK